MFNLMYSNDLMCWWMDVLCDSLFDDLIHGCLVVWWWFDWQFDGCFGLFVDLIIGLIDGLIDSLQDDLIDDWWLMFIDDLFDYFNDAWFVLRFD